MKKKLLFLMALLVSSTMAWAQTAPEGLSIDTDYSPGQEGYYYVNMPNHEDGRSIKFSSPDLVFKIYDDGGKNDVYSNGYYSLQLEAPVGCCFEIEGTIVELDDDALIIYNSWWADHNNELYGYIGEASNVTISKRRTTDNKMYIYFSPNNSGAGFELTVRIKPRGQGTEENPYEIWYSEAWNLLCTNVAGGETYADKYFKQMADLTVTQGVGTDAYAFSGHYDGNGKTLDCSISAAGQAAAPFCRVDGAEIKDLIVTGSVATTMTDGADHTAGLIGKAAGTVTINNVRVLATVTGLTYYGGFIADGGSSTITMTGCVFDGQLMEKTAGETQYAGGFIGWGGNMSITMSDCLFAGTSTIAASGSGARNFHPVGFYGTYNTSLGSLTLTNVYTTVPSATHDFPNSGAALSSDNVKQVYSITTTDANVTTFAISGSPVEYNVSGLKRYATGIACGSTLYAGSDESLSLTLGHADVAGQHFTGYEVSGGGNLSNATTDAPTLTMTAANQVISAVYADNPSYVVAFADGTDTGWSTEPTGTARDGETVTVSYTGEHKVKSVTVKAKDIIAGKFRVSDTKLVYFSKGNLQATYNGNDEAWTWAFAKNQWDYIGNAEGNTKVTDSTPFVSGYTGTSTTVDLFGWVGASSNFEGAAQYGITSSTTTNSTDGYGNKVNENLKKDWGETMGDGWYTLSRTEWNYLFNPYNRHTTSGVLYAKATVNGVKGVILLPDDWSTSYYTLNSTNTGDANFSANTINASTWTNILEAHGAVFLPAAGHRYGSYVYDFETGAGHYWSSSSYPDQNSVADKAYYLDFTNTELHPQFSSTTRYYGYSVRLVRNVP